MTIGGRHQKVSEFSDRLTQTSLLAGLRRYPWTVLVFVPLFALLALTFERAAPDVYAANAQIIVEDPRASTLFQVTDSGRPSTQASERYLADQVAIIRSTVAAEIAESLLDGETTAADILESTEVTGDAVSNEIVIRAEATSPETSKAMADALAAAYIQIRRDDVQESARTALIELEGLLSAVDQDLEDVNARIEAKLSENQARDELQGQFDDALAELNQLRTERDAQPIGSVERADLNTQIDELLRDFQTWSVILNTNVQDPELDALLSEQNALVNERSDLVANRNSISVAAEVASDPVTLFSPAQLPTDASGLGTLVVAAAMMVLGLVVAASVAFYLSERFRIVTDRNMVESVLEAPLLAELPASEAVTASNLLPILSSPESKSAQMFRYAGAAIDMRASVTSARSIVVVSARAGDAQHAIVTNVAIAGALAGLRLLVIDADFHGQGLTRQLFGTEGGPGLSDLLAGLATPEQAIHHIPIEAAPDVGVVPRGERALESSTTVRTEQSRRILRRLVEEHDLVLIDVPPILEATYATSLARNADALLVLVEHGQPLDEFERLVERLDIIDTPLLGYIYYRGKGRSWSPATWRSWFARVRSGLSNRREEQIAPEAPVVSDDTDPSRTGNPV
jgi:Mrp family chromosome partitioning ATPase/uncharacterized protein involved in exopolysaccharide biosynthesis